ncbi:helix-turn-helix transcriptional regulator [Bartonella sp. AR 15-3]|uniref:helix-turn-helix transcriptional regulator n=1 Tax=Bartonella sp. AR 15-3 TaxID=545617 RepID=UPI0001F4BCC8|nr:helix-turn-helix transcriptional regulator [Bartonella sp. AR 15-3]OPB31424.1 HTH-type transcriptional regulator / antitoxin HipB [Bartonella sp. AR 15-3]CBI78655.1 putative HTH-type transcriptional regulator hipB [Bartonella sp. AR 15-3]
MDQREDFKNLTKSIRNKFNWTQSGMAKMLGVTQAAVCKWEKRGSISVINYLKLQKLKGSSDANSVFNEITKLQDSSPPSFCDDFSG